MVGVGEPVIGGYQAKYINQSMFVLQIRVTPLCINKRVYSLFIFFCHSSLTGTDREKDTLANGDLLYKFILQEVNIYSDVRASLVSISQK